MTPASSAQLLPDRTSSPGFADGFGLHIDKAYIYFAMAFSVFVEVLNLVRKGKRQRHVVELNPTFVKDSPDATPTPPAESATPTTGSISAPPAFPAAKSSSPR